jgi:hypothetical protein
MTRSLTTRLASLSAALLLVLVLVPQATADNVNNDVVAGGNDTVDEGNSTTIRYHIVATGVGSDGQSGCNVVDSSPATVTLSVPSPVVASASSLLFTACGVGGAKFVSFQSPTAGDYPITVSVSDSGVGRYSINANFTLHVQTVAPPPPPPPPADTDLPTIVASPAAGSGWYNLSTSAPTISFQCADASSAIVSCPANVTLGEGAGQRVSGQAVDAAGNVASVEAGPFDVDLTPPSIAADLPQDGWYGLASGAPSASFQCSDALSGLASCPAAQPLGEGAGQVVEGTAWDVAGNSASASAGPFDVDLTAPSIEASLSPALPEGGWYNLASGAPTAHFECSDALSGLASCSADEILGEGLDQSAEGSALDLAGNDASASTDPVDIDLTAPSIEASLSPALPEGGWYNLASGAPTVHFECSDALSGLASCSEDQLLGAGLDQSAEGSALDLAGNAASASSDPVDIDLAAPTLSLPADLSVFATVVGGGPASFSVSASDDLDAAPDVSCSAASGDQFALGSTPVTCQAVDDAGNSAEGSFNVTVRYNSAGLFQPVKMNKLNTVKAGSTVPLKFAIRTPGGGQIGDLAAVTSFATQSIPCVPMLSDPIQFTTTGGTSLRYDAVAGQFIQNWQTPKEKGCVRTTVTLADRSQLSALFLLK